MLQRWLALPYCSYCLRLAALSHSYFNPLYLFLLNTPQQTQFPNGRRPQSLPFLFLQIRTKSLASATSYPFPATSPVSLL